LRIIKKYISDKNRTTEPRTPEENISTVLAPAEIIQAIMLKSMVPDPEWFNGHQMRFED